MKNKTDSSFNLCWSDHKGNPYKTYDLSSCLKVTIEAEYVTDNDEVPNYLDLMFVDETDGSYPGGWPTDPQQLVTMALALKDMCNGIVDINWTSIYNAAEAFGKVR